MRRYACGWLAVLLVAGCSRDGLTTSAYSAVELPYPLALESAVPDGVPRHDVLERDGCYYFRKDGAIYPIPSDHAPTDGARQRSNCSAAG